MEYVVGLLFDTLPRPTNVALIRKNRPPRQARLLNGIGGKREPGESWHEAMSREFEEEAGVRIEPSAWCHTVTLVGDGHEVRFFRASSESLFFVKTMTDEEVIIEEVHWDEVGPHLDRSDVVFALQETLSLSLGMGPGGVDAFPIVLPASWRAVSWQELSE